MTTTAHSRVQLLMLLALLPTLFFAQPTDSLAPERVPMFLGARAHYGFIIPHSKSIAPVSGSHPFGLEANVQWLMAREKDTRESGVIAKRGFLIYYLNYDQPRLLGYCLSVAPYIEPLIRPDQRLYGALQMGLGVSYLSKVYDRNTNPTNLFFSTHISFLAFVNAYLYFKANPHWDVSLGFNYNHISNGGMKNPNKGMNFPTWNTGTAYHFRPAPIRRALRNREWKNRRRAYAYLHAAGSIKTAGAGGGVTASKPAWLLGGTAMAGWRVGRLSGLAAGTEWIHDGWVRQTLDQAGNHSSALKGGLMFGHELLTGKVRFSVLMGVYVYNPSGDRDPVYQRYGIFYRIGKHLQLGATLKAHRHVADVFDLRVGWLW